MIAFTVVNFVIAFYGDKIHASIFTVVKFITVYILSTDRYGYSGTVNMSAFR